MKVYLGLGGNIGNTQQFILAALSRLEREKNCKLLQLSSPYRTPPWGNTNQSDFVNACCSVETDLSAQQFLLACQDCEHALQRERNEKWGPRTIDIDLLLLEPFQAISSASLIVPHPHLTQRGFVLVPLNEIAPDLSVYHKTIRQWLHEIDQNSINKITPSKQWGALQQRCHHQAE